MKKKRPPPKKKTKNKKPTEKNEKNNVMKSYTTPSIVNWFVMLAGDSTAPQPPISVMVGQRNASRSTASIVTRHPNTLTCFTRQPPPCSFCHCNMTPRASRTSSVTNLLPPQIEQTDVGRNHRSPAVHKLGRQEDLGPQASR